MSGSDHVNPPSSGQKLTCDDFLLFPEDDRMRHELIDGEHIVTPSPVVRHQRIVGNIFFFIQLWLEDHPVGACWGGDIAVVLSNVNVLVPDVQYASKERLAQISTETNFRGAPNLVVEVLSPATRKRDETVKRRLYERFGVDEYWIVDPETDVVRIYRRDGNVFARVIELSRDAGDVVTTPLLPGFELPLSRIFRE